LFVYFENKETIAMCLA